MARENNIPTWEKVTMTLEEASEYSNIGIHKIRELANHPCCPFVLYVGSGKRLIKRKAFEDFIEKTEQI